jgi:hypothetical protein
MAPGRQQGGQRENLLEKLQPPNHPIATGIEELGLLWEAAGSERMEAISVEFFFDLSMGIGEEEGALELGRKILFLDCSRIGTGALTTPFCPHR